MDREEQTQINCEDQKHFDDEGLSPIIEKLENNMASWFKENPIQPVPLLAIIIAIILSPLVIFWFDEKIGKEWSEVVKHVVESGAVLAAVFALIKWVDERRDRGTDVLLSLETKFKTEKILEGRNVIEDRDHDDPTKRCDKLDAMLRFYVVLYGVYVAKQVPQRSLSVCFRYWLTFYFHKERPNFRAYVERFYPTLTRWLREDCKKDCVENGRFFTPHRLFKDKADTAFIDACKKDPIP